MTAIHTPQPFHFNQLQQSFSPSEHWIWSSSHPGLQMIKFSRFTKASEISNTVDHCPLSVTGKPLSVGYPVNTHQCGLLDPLGPHLPSHHTAIISVFTASSPLYADFLNLQLFLSVSSELNSCRSPLLTSSGKAITIHLVVSARKTGLIRGWVLTLQEGQSPSLVDALASDPTLSPQSVLWFRPSYHLQMTYFVSPCLGCFSNYSILLPGQFF